MWSVFVGLGVQEPGRAERAFARYDYLTVMKKFLLITRTDFLASPPGMELVKDFSTLASPLNEIIKKHVGFKWKSEQEEAFN